MYQKYFILIAGVCIIEIINAISIPNLPKKQIPPAHLVQTMKNNSLKKDQHAFNFTFNNTCFVHFFKQPVKTTCQ